MSHPLPQRLLAAADQSQAHPARLSPGTAGLLTRRTAVLTLRLASLVQAPQWQAFKHAGQRMTEVMGESQR